ncbi:SDR family oxidoreductase [Alteraurantiacibacter aestuarii]|uniref:NAD(P)H-binding protein n=1 Tax=Alteraurantiacibacter aestuarii TaxID=650004 RepID=A0A844ZII3_9SPHN|nr:NAD(P)H-binding protein [Alteraurantiacibacter aestuarii]
MGKIIVTGASGQFGNAAAKQLLEIVPAEDLVFLSRTPEKLAEFAETGAHIRCADFDDPASLPAAMEGGERMLLISTARVGTRVGQHTNAARAAAAAGVRQIAYTSIINCDRPDNPAIVKNDHLATEQAIRATGVEYTFLRDNQYSEAIALAMAIPALQMGVKPDNCGQGRVGFVSRDDCVNVAVGVLTQEGHGNHAYPVTGPEAISIPEAMAMVSQMAGKPIEVQHVDDEGMFAYFDSLGVPRHASDIVPDGPIPWSSDDMVTFGTAIRAGFMDEVSDCVERITGKTPRTLRSVFEQYQGAWPV